MVIGVDLSIDVALFPNLPLLLYPQVHKVPSVLTAAVCPLPQETCFQSVPPANVVIGVETLSPKDTTRFPNFPPDGSPQVHKVPSVLIATLNVFEQQTCFQLVPPANVVTGVDIDVDVIAFPIFPEIGLPQIHKVPSVLIAAVC